MSHIEQCTHLSPFSSYFNSLRQQGVLTYTI